MIQAFNPSMLSIPSVVNPGSSGRDPAGFSSTIGNAREQNKVNQGQDRSPQTPAAARPAPAAGDPTYAGKVRPAPSQSAPVRRPSEAAGGPRPDERKTGVSQAPGPEPVPTPKLPPAAETDIKIELEPAEPVPSRGFSAPAPDMGPGMPAPWPQPAAAQTQLRLTEDAELGTERSAAAADPAALAAGSRRQLLAQANTLLNNNGPAGNSRTQAALQRAADGSAKAGPQAGLPNGLGRSEPGPTPPGVTLPIAHDALHPGGAQSGSSGNSGNSGNTGSDSSQRGLNLLGGAANAAASSLPAAASQSFAQALAAAAPAALNPINTPASSEAMIQAAPGSAEFAAQTSVQLTVFAREGVQHARLHLNPAEMGPVTVQIQLEGQAAQVHLAAENALTRQALQDALPQLASQLRESGLSLSGGGVFEQPRQDSPNSAAMQQRDGSGSAGGSSALNGRSGAVGNGQEGSGALDARPVSFSTRRGIVDLVA